MIVGRIAVGIIIFAVIMGILYGYECVISGEAPSSIETLIITAILVLSMYCTISGVYLLVKAGVV